MKTISFLLAITVLLSIKVQAQSTKDGWFWQYPKPQGNTLNDIYVFDSTTAVAVGDLGTIIKTTDGGESWDVQHHACGTTLPLQSVYFIDEINGWAAGGIWQGSSNVLLKTTDGGKNWTEVKTNSSLPYLSVYFVDKDTGFVVGDDGVVLRTTDGGVNWDVKNMNDYIGGYLDVFRLLAITFTDKNTGFIVGGGYYGNQIYKTTDCGRTWQWNENVIRPKLFGNLIDICFTDKNHGFITGQDCAFLKTTDGGVTWVHYDLWEKYRKEYYQFFNSIAFRDSLNGFIVGGDYNNSFILRTTDGGENWIEDYFQQNLYESFIKVRFTDASIGWAVGGNGIINKTTNAGKDWLPQREGSPNWLNSIYFTNQLDGWAVGEKGIILHTSDGGEQWENQDSKTTDWLWEVFFIDNENGWVVGNTKYALKTVDGGANWNQIIPDNNLGGYSSVFFINPDTGWVVSRKIVKTTNGGTSWFVQDSNMQHSWSSIYFYDSQIGWAADENGNIGRTTDGGNHWSISNIDSMAPFHCIYFIDDKKGWVVGNNNDDKNFFKTEDGGSTWKALKTYGKYDLYSVYFVNKNIGWTSGYNTIERKAFIAKSSDSGENWIEQIVPASELSDVFFINEITGYTTSWGIFKTNTGGVITDINSKKDNIHIPQKLKLSQNYPNPFNPGTSIEYYLPVNSHVQLQIYNVLGQEVELLVDKQQNAGSYKIDWMPKYIASGIYIYRLITTEGIITKKMLLLR